MVASFTGDTDLPTAVEELTSAGADVVLLTNSPTLARQAGPAQAAVAAIGLPVVAATSVFDQALLVLQPDTTDLYRQLARQAARLLSGTPVSEVPVEDPAKFRLVVNVGAAGRLGLNVPPAVLEFADHVVR